MDKQLLHEKIIQVLESMHQSTVNAALQAHDTATNKESIAENKYDTFGLEASYLAHGQAQRAAECEEALAIYRDLSVINFNHELPIAVGALVYLEDATGIERCLFLSPVAGGIKVSFNNKAITLITPLSPLGTALVGRGVGDEVELTLAGQKTVYEITAIY